MSIMREAAGIILHSLAKIVVRVKRTVGQSDSVSETRVSRAKTKLDANSSSRLHSSFEVEPDGSPIKMSDCGSPIRDGCTKYGERK